jgi:aspartyl-tRNA(Asn)/glutamyl-tRNA(Gln) amidotransferase subunit A
LLETIAGEYPKGAERPDYRKLQRALPKRFRIGWPEHYYFDRVDAEVRRLVEDAARVLRSLGAQIVNVGLPGLAEILLPATNDIALAEATAYHQSQGFFPARAGDYGDDVRKLLESGAQVLAVNYLRGCEKKREAVQVFEAAFSRVDAIIAPAAPVPAPQIGQREVEIEGEKETVRSALVRMNRPANFTGHPAISVPCGFTSSGMPVGMQVIGPHWSEARLLALAAAYEEATDWHKRRPDLEG